MWIIIWRPLVVLVAIAALGDAALLAAVAPKNPFAVSVLWGIGIAIIVFQIAVSTALLVTGVWIPARRWVAAFSHRRPARA